MQLFFTDKTFVRHGIVRPEVPFLCSSTMELVKAPNSYLLFISTVKGRTRSSNTWKTYANHLYEFFSYLESGDLCWLHINASILASWRDGMMERGCSNSTVNQRLRCIHGFYKWAINAKLVIDIPFATEEVRIKKHQGLLTHVDNSGNFFDANELTIQTFEPPPQFLMLCDALKFLEALSPKSLKLMGYLALLTGMRREEITALNYKILPNPCGYDPGKQMKMLLNPRITPTKGKKTRTVMVPYDLAVALWNYFCGEWLRRNAMHKKKYGYESERLFLSEYGEELSIRYLNNSFAKASLKINISCHPHMLRHTYATYELIRMSNKYGELKALLWLKDRLGHSSIKTTEKYIHAIDLLKNMDVDDYQLEILGALHNGIKAK